MDGCRHKDHEQARWWCDLEGRRRSSHHEPNRPETVSRKREGHHCAAPESRTEIKEIGHPFEGAVDTADQRNMFDPPFCPGDHTLSYYMGGNGADNENNEQKQDEADAWPFLDSDVPRQVINQFVECVK